MSHSESIHEAYGDLLEVVDVLGADLERFLTDNGLSVPRAHLLWLLHELGPTPQHELARRLNVTPRNVTGLVDALSAGGLVERTPHPTDRRSFMVGLTTRGVEFTSRVDAERIGIAETLFGEWSESELAQFSYLIRRCTRTLRALGEA